MARAAGARPSGEGPVVVTRTGRLRGRAEAELVVFRGIPYAAPPVGALRWRPPRPASSWPGVRAAAAFGACAMQTLRAGDRGSGPGGVSEDCLTLNVWAPAAPARPAPVMVWIHGGGYATGSGSAPLYDGAALAHCDVVVVTLTYRLGRFGVFAHPALAAEPGPKANFGLMDIIAALTWVRDNISAFGADPDCVTIFGQSSGGHAVNRLMVSPAARGLFQRAIVQSGGGRDPETRLGGTRPGGLASAEAQGKAFMSALAPDARTAADLRGLQAAHIIAAGDSDDPSIGGGPVIDGQLLPLEMVDAFHRGLQAPVPYLIGCNSLEVAPSGARLEALIQRQARAWGADLGWLEAAYGDAAQFRTRVASDVVFSEPARNLAALHAAGGHPAFLYRFSFTPPALRERASGAPHGAERRYVFGTLGESSVAVGDADQAMARTLQGYWTAFAGSGDPNHAGAPPWPRYDACADRLMDFGDAGPAVTGTPHKPALDALATRQGAKASSPTATTSSP